MKDWTFYKYCKEEAHTIEEHICLDRKITFSSLLTKSLQRVAVYMNVEVKKRIGEVDFKAKFSFYSNMLKHRVKLASKSGKEQAFFARGWWSFTVLRFESHFRILEWYWFKKIWIIAEFFEKRSKNFRMKLQLDYFYIKKIIVNTLVMDPL